MGRFVAIAIVLVLGACSKKTAPEECAAGKADFMSGLREAFAGRATTPDAKAFFDKKLAHAEASFDAYCKTVTDDEWKCLHDVIEKGDSPTGPCKPAVDRLMKDVLDESDPDYH
jgi:hypothetical protein